MEQWTEIRRRVLVENISKRQILRETGMHWKTLEKILAHSEPPGYRQSKTRIARKMGAYLWKIEQILTEDEGMPRKQRHTMRRIHQRLKEAGYDGCYASVWHAVSCLVQKRKEVFMPLSHLPGEAQVDFGHALVKVNGVLKKVAFFVMALPYSDAFFVQAFEKECTESFWEGHVRAFEYFGGVPRRITYDNSRVAVSQIIGGTRERKLTAGFLQLQSHYLFGHHFCLVRRANEKGVVEGTVKYIRLNFFVPVPQLGDLEGFNPKLSTQCRDDLQRKLRGKTQSKALLLEEEKKEFLPLPAAAFEASRKQSTTASSLSLVRFDSNDYSVPVAYAHHPIVVRGFCREVSLNHLGREVARHKRIWEREQVCFEPLHYLALLEKKPGSLDHARPLEGWQLPECFGILRQRLENERKGDGTREYIRVLRLLEKHSLKRLTGAVEQGLSFGALTRDAIAQFLYPSEDWRATIFMLDDFPHLRRVRVEPADVGAYQTLLTTCPEPTEAVEVAGGVR